MHLEVFSIAPLLDENFFQKSFDRLPDEGLWAHRKEKILRQKKAEDRCLTLAAGLLARRAFLKMKVSFSALSLEKAKLIFPFLILRDLSPYPFSPFCVTM